MRSKNNPFVNAKTAKSVTKTAIM